jgi:hypothetical protein
VVAAWDGGIEESAFNQRCVSGERRHAAAAQTLERIRTPPGRRRNEVRRAAGKCAVKDAVHKSRVNRSRRSFELNGMGRADRDLKVSAVCHIRVWKVDGGL